MEVLQLMKIETERNKRESKILQGFGIFSSRSSLIFLSLVNGALGASVAIAILFLFLLFFSDASLVSFLMKTEAPYKHISFQNIDKNNLQKLGNVKEIQILVT